VKDVIYDIDNSFTIPKLKAMCTALGIAVGGAKAQLQTRLTTHLNLLLTRQDTARYNLAKSTAEAQRGISYGAGPRSQYRPRNSNEDRTLNYSRPNGYHASSTPASLPSPAQTSSTSNNWGMPSVYHNIRLRTYPSTDKSNAASRLQATTLLYASHKRHSSIYRQWYPFLLPLRRPH